MDHIRAARYFCFATATLLLLAALWYTLHIFNIIIPAGPSYDETISRSENIQQFFLYQQSVAIHELGFTSAAALAFLLVAPLGTVLREIFKLHKPLSTTAGAFLVVASCLLVTGQLTQIGTQRAILPFSRDEMYDPLTLGVIWDTGLMISNWLENGGYFSLALGMVCWALVGRHLQFVPRGWVILSSLLAAALFTVVLCQALEIWTIYDIALSLPGAILAPAWFLLTAQVCATAE